MTMIHIANLTFRLVGSYMLVQISSSEGNRH